MDYAKKSNSFNYLSAYIGNLEANRQTYRQTYRQAISQGKGRYLAISRYNKSLICSDDFFPGYAAYKEAHTESELIIFSVTLNCDTAN